MTERDLFIIAFPHLNFFLSEILGLMIEGLQICAILHRTWWKLITFKACLITLAIVVVLCLVAKSCLTLQPQGLQHARLPHPSPSPSLLKLMSIESVMPFSHLILYCPLLLSSVLPSIRVCSNELALHLSWPKYWSFSFSISPSNEHSGLISFRIDWFDWSKGLSRVFSNTTFSKHQFVGTQPASWSNSHICTWLLEKP